MVPELPDAVDEEKDGGDDDDNVGMFIGEDKDESDKSTASSDPAVIIQKGTFSWVDPDAVPAPVEPPKKKRMSRKERRESQRREKEEKKKQKEQGKLAASSHSSISMGDGGDGGVGVEGSKQHPSTNSLNRAESLASLGVSINTVDEEKDSAESRIALKSISCSIERGSLVAVVGTVGSGKSSFLSAILGEMESIDGTKVYMPPSKEDDKGEGKKVQGSRENLISYCSQSPWVVNDTLRGNILFGRTYNKERYDQVVEACALSDDLAVLPAGDMTEIGERGINLSGGQKARVALARAMYSPESQLILMDDPLSAVDAHVGEHLFKEAITGDVCKGATRVLVTHHVHFLPRCDNVIVLEKGMVKHAGRYQDLVAQGVDFAGAIDVAKDDGKDGGNNDEDNDDGKADEAAKDGKASGEKEGDVADKDGSEAKADKTKMKKAGEKLVTDEEQNEGSVEGSMYSHYAKAGGTIAFIFIFIIQGVGKASEIMANFWLSIWAEATGKAALDQTTVDSIFYINIYAVFGIGGVICLTGRALTMAIHRLKASRRLHDDLTKSILRAPVAFFDVTVSREPCLMFLCQIIVHTQEFTNTRILFL